MKKVLSWIVLLMFISNCFTLGAYASSGSDNWRKETSIENSYGIQLTAEDKLAENADIYSASLDTIGEIYSRFPKGLIKEAADYFKEKKVSTTAYIRYFNDNDNEMIHGTFDTTGGKATITYRVGGGVLEGDVVAHEMGHFLHAFLQHVTDSVKMQNIWTSFNGSYTYHDDWTAPQDGYLNAFARSYGAKNYSEDVATIIEELVIRPDDVRRRIVEKPDSPFAQKIMYLNKLLAAHTESVSSGQDLWGTALPQSPSDWAKGPAKLAFDTGLIPDGSQQKWAGFRTDFRGLYTSNITRYDFAQLIAAYIQKKTGMSLTDFVKSKGKYTAWYNKGSISFDGERNINREETNYPFNDVNDSLVFHLYALGIIDGVPDETVDPSGVYRKETSTWIIEIKGLANKKFEPGGELTREQAAALLYRTSKVLGLTSFKSHIPFEDHEEISDWAQDAVDYVTSNRVMSGVWEAQFAPQDKLTYEQAYMTMLNFSSVK